MPGVKQRTFFSTPLLEAVRTGNEMPVMRDYGRDDSTREEWQRLIDRLLGWLRDPSQLADDGIQAPSGMIIRLSIDLAEKFRDATLMPPPNSVIPDPNGGIVFERCENDVSEVYHVWEDGCVEYMRFQGTQIAERRTL